MSCEIADSLVLLGDEDDDDPNDVKHGQHALKSMYTARKEALAAVR